MTIFSTLNRRFFPRSAKLKATTALIYCAERLTATVNRTGIRNILLMVEGTGDLRRTLETIERVGSEVVPQLGS